MVSGEKESRPFQTGRTDEGHYFFRLIKCGNWPVGYFIYGERAKLLLPFFLSVKVQIWVCSPALLPDSFTMDPEGNGYWFNLSCVVVNQQVYKLLIDRGNNCVCCFLKLYDHKNNLDAIEGVISDWASGSSQPSSFSFIIKHVINVIPFLAQISDWL